MSREPCPKCNSSTGYGEVKCFRCGYVFVRTTSPLRLDIKLEPLISDIVKDIGKLVFNPGNFPPKALNWLYSCHMNNEHIIENKIAYMPEKDGLFIPVLDPQSRDMLFYQVKLFNPKSYLTYGKPTNFVPDDITEGWGRLIIVEDYISYIRLVDAGYNAMPLFGTSIKLKDIERILERYRHVTMWLDSDAFREDGRRPGVDATFRNLKKLQEAAEIYCIKMAFVGITCKFKLDYVNYDKAFEDPKHYFKYEIRDMLEDKIEDMVITYL